MSVKHVMVITGEDVWLRFRAALQSASPWNVRATSAARPDLLLGPGRVPPRLLCRYGPQPQRRQSGCDVTGKQQAALVPRRPGQIIGEELLPVQPVQFSADPY